MHEELELIRKSMNANNKALKQTIQQLIEMDDEVSVETPEELRAESEAATAGIDVAQGAEKREDVTITGFDCQFEGCGWKPKAGTQRPETALRMHIFQKHKDV